RHRRYGRVQRQDRDRRGTVDKPEQHRADGHQRHGDDAAGQGSANTTIRRNLRASGWGAPPHAMLALSASVAGGFVNHRTPNWRSGEGENFAWALGEAKTRAASS